MVVDGRELVWEARKAEPNSRNLSWWREEEC